MSYYLYLDDERTPKIKRDWVIVRSYDEFINTIKDKGTPVYISFDHDLGPGKTGMDCAKWLVENDIVVPEVNVHSANSGGGAENIRSLMKNWINYKKYNSPL